MSQVFSGDWLMGKRIQKEENRKQRIINLLSEFSFKRKCKTKMAKENQNNNATVVSSLWAKETQELETHHEEFIH